MIRSAPVIAAADVGSNKPVTYTASLTDGTGKASNYKLTTKPEVTVNITKVAGSVTAPTAKTDLVYTGEALNLINSGSSDTGEIQYSLNGEDYGTDLPTGIEAGEYTVYYKVVGDGNHNDVAAQSIKANIAKADGSVTAPAAKTDLVYNGEAQTLIIASSSDNGEIQYKLGDDGSYSTQLPQATESGEYTVYYKVVGDKNHNDVAAQSFKVTIAKADIAVTAPTAKTDLVYNGEAQKLIGAASSSIGTVQYSLDGTNYSAELPAGMDAKGYTVYYKVANDNENYNDVAVKSLNVIIAPATVTISVKEQSAYVGSTAPALGEDAYTVSGLFGEDKLTTVPVLKYVDADGNEIAPDMTKTGETTIRASGASAGSNYTISYTDGKLTVSTRPSSGGGSSSSKPTYAVTTPSKTDSGAVSVTPKNAGKGDKVTVTITPDEGYKLDKLTVTDAKGNTLTVTDKGNGKYTFTMPDGKVTVTPTFTKVAEKQPSDSKSFTDVSSSDWYTDAVEYVADKGLMSGTGNDRFSPNDSTTRGMLMTILARYAGEDTIGGATWYEKGMNWAKANGVSDGTNPNVNITREQLVTMLYRYAKASGKDVSVGEDTNILSYADAATVSEYAISAMQWACGAGIVNGSNGNLNPQNNATRAEVAAILMRFCENVK